jgi:hypothetical protein
MNGEIYGEPRSQNNAGRSSAGDEQTKDQLPESNIKNAAYADYAYEVENDDEDIIIGGVGQSLINNLSL